MHNVQYILLIDINLIYILAVVQLISSNIPSLSVTHHEFVDIVSPFLYFDAVAMSSLCAEIQS